jgi:hypothetical protein
MSNGESPASKAAKAAPYSRGRPTARGSCVSLFNKISCHLEQILTQQAAMAAGARRRSVKGESLVTVALVFIANVNSGGSMSEKGVPLEKQLGLELPFLQIVLCQSMLTYLSSPREDDIHVLELVERSQYMEKLLRHYVSGISLDTESLRRLSDSIPTDNLDAQFPSENTQAAEDQSNEEPFNDTEDLTLDENFTVKPLAHNTTRQLATSLACRHF